MPFLQSEQRDTKQMLGFSRERWMMVMVDDEEELRESAVDLALPQMEGIFVSICALA